MAVIESTAEVIDITDTAPKGKSRKCKTAAEKKEYIAKRAPEGSKTARGLGTGAGNGKAFSSSQDLLDKLSDYCDYIKSTGYREYPTKGGFAEWLNINRKTLWNSINNYYPDCKKEYMSIIEETLINGVNARIYKDVFTMFILKNWCEWKDRKENITTGSKPQIASKAELKEAITAYLQAPVDE